MTPSPETLAKDLRAVTLHELCHMFSAMDRCEAMIVSFNVNRFYGLHPMFKAWDGRAKVMAKDGDKFLDSVYGWAGIVGEVIEEDRKNAVDIAWDKYVKSRDSISDTDLKNIEQIELTERRKSAQAAYDTLLKKWEGKDGIKDIRKQIVDLIEIHKLFNYECGWIKGTGWLLKD